MNPKETAINLTPETFAERCDRIIQERIKAKEETDNRIINTTFESIKTKIENFVKVTPLNIKEEEKDYIYDNNLKYTQDHLLVIIEMLKTLGFEVNKLFHNSNQNLQITSEKLKIRIDFSPQSYKMELDTFK